MCRYGAACTADARVACAPPTAVLVAPLIQRSDSLPVQSCAWLQREWHQWTDCAGEGLGKGGLQRYSHSQCDSRGIWLRLVSWCYRFGAVWTMAEPSAWRQALKGVTVIASHHLTQSQSVSRCVTVSFVITFVRVNKFMSVHKSSLFWNTVDIYYYRCTCTVSSSAADALHRQ